MRIENFIGTFIVAYLLLSLNYVISHLKDMGEVSANWTRLIYDLEKRIVGGEVTTLEEQPYNIKFINLGSMCGGSILTHKTVLTAAHCFDYNTNLAEMTVLSKSRYLFDIKANHHKVWDFILHERYNHTNIFSNDIAILIIHNKFEFGPSVQRAYIANTDVWMRDNESFLATGWGETTYGGSFSKTGILKTTLHYISRNECMRENEIVLGEEMFCLYGDGKRDTCRGDSGGGILWNNAIVGIVSHGRGCATTPSVYVNVYRFKGWIQSTVRKLNKKFCKFHDNKVY